MTNENAGATPATNADLNVVLAVEPLLEAAVALRVAIDAVERERLGCTRALPPDELYRHWAASQVGVRHAAEVLRQQIDTFVATALTAANALRQRNVAPRQA